MFIKELSTTDVTYVYKTYMTDDFPPEELKPLSRILFTMNEGLCRFLGLYDNDTFVGYSVFITPKNCKHCLLDYFAITADYRNKGYGHIFFDIIGDFLCENSSELEGIFIESESIGSAIDENDRIIKERRCRFYLDNGCLETTLASRLFGVEYDIFFYPFEGRLPDDQYEALNNLYIEMFTEKHYSTNVFLWNKGK